MGYYDYIWNRVVPLWARPGMMHRLKPICGDFGFARGWPIDRYYIEDFLNSNKHDIRGEVLEAGIEPNYTRQFGGERVTRSHIMYPTTGKPGATLVGDLATGEGIPSDAFDCAILTQVFQFIYDMHSATRNSHRMLKEDGVVLATFAGISQISMGDMKSWGEYWRVTTASARRMFGDVFGPENVTVEAYGNVLTACSALHGLVISDLTRRELDYVDPEYEVIVSVRAVKR